MDGKDMNLLATMVYQKIQNIIIFVQLAIVSYFDGMSEAVIVIIYYQKAQAAPCPSLFLAPREGWGPEKNFLSIQDINTHWL